MQCNSCLQQGEGEGGPKVQIYWGETSRTLFQRGKEHWAAYASKSEASVLHKHESEHHQNAPAEWKMKVYNYHSKPLRRQIEEGVLINNARGGELLNSKSEMTRGEKIPRLVIMVGDKEVHNVCSERKRVEAHTHESSPEIVPECVGRKSKMIIPGVKRQTQPLISEVVKKIML